MAKRMAVLTGVQAEGLAGRVPLRICGESGMSQCRLAGPKDPKAPPASDKASVACVAPGLSREGRRQKQDVLKSQQRRSC